MSRSTGCLYLMTLLVLALPAQGNQVTESFDSRTTMESSTALWNQGLGKLTPTMNLTGWDAGTGANTSAVDFGDGSHGEFNSSTWANFGSVDTTGKIIYLNTDTYSTFKFTKFTLDAPWKIQPVGSNPLKIYVLGNMIVSGNISCTGRDGNASTGSGASAVAGAGGLGRCGGARGGNGADKYSSGINIGESGQSNHGSMSGGIGGRVDSGINGAGGGGGGAWSTLNQPGTNAAGGDVPGARGTGVPDKGWTNVLGSSGGGGGSGSALEAGGGGGAGGGVIIIHVAGNLNVSTGAVIEAKGGAGGTSPSTGGEGGGGGGGSIQVWVGGTLSLEDAFNVEQITAKSGLGGSSSASGGDGGSGYAGRIWISALNFPALNGATYAPVMQINNEGTMQFVTATAQTAITNPMDTFSTVPSFSAGSFSPSSNDIAIEVAGSRDYFQNDNSGWVSLSNIAQLNEKRFLKFKITITNTNATTPSTVDVVSATYTPGTVRDFDMQTSGCGMIGNGQGPSGPLVIVFALLVLLIPIIAISALARSIRSNPSVD